MELSNEEISNNNNHLKQLYDEVTATTSICHNNIVKWMWSNNVNMKIS